MLDVPDLQYVLVKKLTYIYKCVLIWISCYLIDLKSPWDLCETWDIITSWYLTQTWNLMRSLSVWDVRLLYQLLSYRLEITMRSVWDQRYHYQLLPNRLEILMRLIFLFQGLCGQGNLVILEYRFFWGKFTFHGWETLMWDTIWHYQLLPYRLDISMRSVRDVRLR